MADYKSTLGLRHKLLITHSTRPSLTSVAGLGLVRTYPQSSFSLLLDLGDVSGMSRRYCFRIATAVPPEVRWSHETHPSRHSERRPHKASSGSCVRLLSASGGVYQKGSSQFHLTDLPALFRSSQNFLIASIRRAISPVFGRTKDLHRGLLWFQRQVYGQTDVPAPASAPSWSWVAVNSSNCVYMVHRSG